MVSLLVLQQKNTPRAGASRPRNKKPGAVSRPGHSGVVLVNTLFWKILVTRVKRKMCDASVVSLSCCPNSGFARARHHECAKSDCGRELGQERRQRRLRSRLPTAAGAFRKSTRVWRIGYSVPRPRVAYCAPFFIAGAR